MSESETITWIVNEPEMVALADDIAMALRPGDCICLHGDLGAGKTTFARALIRSVAGDHHGQLEVPSPTFTLVQSYDLALPVFHVDAYRIADPTEADELGLDEALEIGIALIEWPDRLEGRVPENRVDLQFSEDIDAPDTRGLTISGPAEQMARITRSLAIRAFLDETWSNNVIRSPLLADASARAYERVELDADSRILMNAPRMPDGPVIRDGKPYSQIAHLAEDVVPFVAIAKALKENGFCAPQIYGSDLDRGLVLLENLGAGSLLDDQRQPIAERYVASVKCLAEMHAKTWPMAIPVSDEITYQVPRFDLDAFLIEAELLVDWYCPRFAGRQLSDQEKRDYRDIWTDLFDQIGHCGDTLILRDFHSPNVIWRDGEAGLDRIGIIDFQDALIGSPAYDVMAIARDARVDIPVDLEQVMMSAYIADRHAGGAFDENAFRTEAAILAAQRICKILGIFVRLDERDGKSAYLSHLPRMRDYLSRSLQHHALTRLKGFLDGLGIDNGGEAQ